MPLRLFILGLLLLATLTTGCRSVPTPSAAPPISTSEASTSGPLQFLGEHIVPNGLQVEGTVVGGRSGLDRAPDGTWFFLSDDRAERGPARFYTATLHLTSDSLAVQFTGMVPLQQPDGTPFPEFGVDPEAIRYDTARNAVVWTSEGDIRNGLDPFVRRATLRGSHIATFPLLARFRAGGGPRNNGVFEGLSQGSDDTFWLATELPLTQDGPAPTPTPAETPIRLTLLDEADGTARAQYAYHLDAVAAAPNPSDGFAVNGVTEILALDGQRLLVLERSFSIGQGNTVRLYLADITGATDVLGHDALSREPYTPVTKHLLLDFADLPLRLVDNLEGLAYGPDLPDGRRTLVLVSDNNFNPLQITQVIALALDVKAL